MLDGLKSAARRVSAQHTLHGLLADCRRLLTDGGDANGAAIARELVARFDSLPDEGVAAFFERLGHDFSPDPDAVLRSAQAYARRPTADNLLRLTRLAEPPRQELLRRINRSPGGTAAIMRMRRLLLDKLNGNAELRVVEADLLHVLSSWFNPGFLQLQRVDWNSPARLLEQIIRHEAVHEIDGWDDLQRRLQPDRRCFAFFHPQLPDEPLIFVEVALVPQMPAAIAPLIDKTSTPLPPSEFKVAVFYSISNCQPGLRGVSLGNFLIKRVARELQRELPQIRTFCTLSPIPTFAAWLARTVEFGALPRIRRAVAERAAAARARLGDVATLDPTRLDAEQQQALQRLCAVYLVHQAPAPQGDPVARFHLDNGARLERMNPGANASRKGIRQSFGMMVNYLYDLDRAEARHHRFVEGEVVHSRGLGTLL